jgi:2-amino-4-hydroxy-6-hydroxymethyldihydropteridine diphosphokinase
MSDVRAPVTAYVAIGANLGDASTAVLCAINDLSDLPQTVLLAQSSLYQTAPMASSGPDYINAVVEISTGLNAHDLLLVLQQMEFEAGRDRPYPNAPRTLDLDVLLYGEAQIDSASLTIPHARMLERAFVLVPLAEIAPARVSNAQLEGVATQAITRLASISGR